MVGPDAGGKIYLFADTDTRGRFVAALGFVQSPEVKELVGEEFFASISPERFDVLDGDGLIVFQETAAAKAQMKEMPSFQALDVVKNGHVVAIDDLELAMALSASSVTSIPYALERVVPAAREGALGLAAGGVVAGERAGHRLRPVPGSARFRAEQGVGVRSATRHAIGHRPLRRAPRARRR